MFGLVICKMKASFKRLIF